jgi:inorganic pyrophosphatase
MNLWHDVPLGDKAPDEINVIIEIPRGSANKYEIDKETGLIALDRVMHTAQVYPIDYGFSPQTLWEDGDALDVMVLATEPLLPGILVRVRPVGVMRMIDDGESDYKVIGVPVKDPRFDSVKDIGDVNEHTLKTIRHFFETYKHLQNKKVEVSGWGDAGEARSAIDKSVELYRDR